MRRIALFFILVLFPLASSIQASSDINVNHLVNYTFDSNGNSHITQNISLTNNLSRTYASHYQLTIQGETPKNITGYDSTGPLKIVTSQLKDDVTKIDIDFNDIVVGLGKSLNFVLNYDGKPATKRGQVWEVSLPRLGEQSKIDDYTLKLTVPASFGQPAFISPSPNKSEDHVYLFTKDQISRVGVVAAFGNFQTFGFTLHYHLPNSSSKSIVSSIALPPDTNYQRVFYDSIEPKPTSVVSDADGNWLASFEVLPHTELEVVTTGQAHVLVEPSVPGPLPSQNQLQNLLKPTQYWQVNDPKIQQLAQQLKTPENIYNYVVATLDYNYARAKPGVIRKGALLALENPTDSICTEFTDLFIALSRAAGIPTREVNGYAYTTDSHLRPLSLVTDVLHAWPEYWDSTNRTWISVDPTWGKTSGGVDYFHKLDLSHMTFAIHGQSDTSPYPAGSYKTHNSSRDIKIDFAPYREYTPTGAIITWTPPFQVWSAVPTPTFLTISNPQGQGIYNIPVEIDTENLTTTSPYLYSIESLPPFSKRDLPLTISSHLKPNFAPKKIIITAGNSHMTYNIDDRLFIFWHTTLVTAFTIVIIVMGFLAHKAWSLRL